jgi:hypothetical protein
LGLGLWVLPRRNPTKRPVARTTSFRSWQAATHCHTVAHCRTATHALPHCHIIPSALPHTAAHCHTLPRALRALPYTATLCCPPCAHCAHTAACTATHCHTLPHSCALPRALPYATRHGDVQWSLGEGGHGVRHGVQEDVQQDDWPGGLL